VKLWDIPSQTAITTLYGHTDYVRAGQISPANPNHILTGSYDSTVRLFDARTGECEITMGTGSTTMPVEQVLMFPSGTLAISSAGPILRVWDIVAGGRCTRALSNHQKTITSLTFNASSSRLLTGGLDHMVKVYDVSTYKVVHTMRYPSPLLCLAVSVSDSKPCSLITTGFLIF
jgi:U3 small nucleolar RNA-associated protein 15